MYSCISAKKNSVKGAKRQKFDFRAPGEYSLRVCMKEGISRRFFYTAVAAAAIGAVSGARDAAGGIVRSSVRGLELDERRRQEAIARLEAAGGRPLDNRMFVPGLARDEHFRIFIPGLTKEGPPRLIAGKPNWSEDFLKSDKEPLKRIEGVKKPLIAITIDDGFAVNSLRSILNTAKNKGITYTDFMKGLQRKLYSDFVKEMIESGIVEFANHSEIHGDQTNSRTDEQKIEDLLAAERFMNTFGQTTLPYFRPPGGTFDSDTLKRARKKGYRCINWIASADGGTTTNVKLLRPGDIVLMHYRDESAAQFSYWIDDVRAQGLEPAALSNVFAAA